MSKPTVSVLITDLDNTLYDWVGYFAKSLAAMIDESVQILKCDREQLVRDLQHVHQRYRDPERPFALLETKTVKEQLPTEQARSLLTPAFQAFNRERRRHLQAYPGVRDTLERLNRSQIPIVAHTEANAIHAIRRLERLDLLRYFSSVYALDSDLAFHAPPPIPVHRVPEDLRKPNPDILKTICSNLKIRSRDAVYVGDSLARDIGMARLAGLRCAWAKYGTAHIKEDWELVVAVSHWSEADIQRAARTQEALGSSKPDAILLNSFDEVLEHVQFQQEGR